MEKNEKESWTVSQKTEQVQQIIEKIPVKFGIYVTAIVLFVFSLLFIFGWAIRYPDLVTGEIVVNSNISPIKLVAEASGKLRLNFPKSSEAVKEGQVIAYIENPTNPKVVYFIDSLLKTYNPATIDVVELLPKLPKDFSIGELNDQYFTFVNSLEQLNNYKEGKLLDKQYVALKRTLVEQNQATRVAGNRLDMALNSLDYAQKNYSRDSLLFLKKVISELELDVSARRSTYFLSS